MIEVPPPMNVSELEYRDEIPINLTVLMRPVWERRIFVAKMTAVGLVTGLVLCFAIRPYYRGHASLIVPSSSGSGALSALSQAGLFSGLGNSKTNTDLYLAILKSNLVVESLVHRFDLQRVYKISKLSVAEKALLKNTSFDVGSKSNVITIEVDDKDPVRARDLANGFLDELAKANSQLAITDAAVKRQFYSEQMNQAKDDLANAEIELRKAQEKSGLVNPFQMTTEFQIVGQLQAEIAADQARLAALLQSATDENPEVIRLRTEIASRRAQLTKMQSGKSSEPGNVPVARVPEAQSDLIRRQREVKYRETLMEVLAKQYEVARVDEAQQDPGIQVLDRARLPDVKAGPSRALILVGMTLFGFIAGVLWILIGVRYAILRARLLE